MNPGDKVWVLGKIVTPSKTSPDSHWWVSIGDFDSIGATVAVPETSMVLAVDDKGAQFEVSKKHPDTSKEVAKKIRAGSLQADIMSVMNDPAYAVHELGWTDDELEERLKRAHQSVSASRNTLVRKGYIVDSGERRMTRSGNPAIVWKLVK